MPRASFATATAFVALPAAGAATSSPGDSKPVCKYVLASDPGALPYQLCQSKAQWAALEAQYAKDAAKIGIDGLMVLPGMVYTSDTRETLHHFRAVARASDLPIMIYNNPIVYRVDIKPETFGDLASERGMEAYLLLWIRLWGTLGTGRFNVNVVR